jgi:predicted RNA-binding Zn-ribbon protein involved in translation (DUF1610 family)
MAVKPSAKTDIGSLQRQHLSSEELRMAAEASATQRYWFKCPNCTFDWPTWLKSSIVFVSLRFVTDECPNCRTKSVPAFKVDAY